MKSMLVIGAGRFGTYLIKALAKLGNEIMLVDRDEKAMEDLIDIVSSAKIGDCTSETVLRSLNVQDFDACFVCISDDFQSSLEITSLLKDLGARYVISKADRDIHAKFLLRNGADRVVYPDRDIAEKVAVAYSSDQVFDYIDLADGYSIYEISPEPKWIGRTVGEVNVRKKYRFNIIAVKNEAGLSMNIGPNYTFRADEHLLVIGQDDDIASLVGE